MVSPNPTTLALAPSHSVLLRDFYPNAADIRIPTAPGEVFKPDDWTQSLARGLETIDFDKKTVIEVGVGCGVNAAGLITTARPPEKIIGTDISATSVHLTNRLAYENGWNVAGVYSNLLKNVCESDLKNADIVFACIPQVPANLTLDAGDNSSHYYNPTGDKWDLYGLGLNADLLEQASNVAPQADIVLNLCGRPGKEKLEALFKEFGRKASVIHEATVPQHAGTSLASLATLEQEGHDDFEFFADPNGDKRINATTAEARRLSEQPVYHKIYVMAAPGLR